MMLMRQHCHMNTCFQTGLLLEPCPKLGGCLVKYAPRVNALLTSQCHSLISQGRLSSTACYLVHQCDQIRKMPCYNQITIPINGYEHVWTIFAKCVVHSAKQWTVFCQSKVYICNISLLPIISLRDTTECTRDRAIFTYNWHHSVST